MLPLGRHLKSSFGYTRSLPTECDRDEMTCFRKLSVSRTLPVGGRPHSCEGSSVEVRWSEGVGDCCVPRKHSTWFQGTIVRPSGRFLLRFERSHGKTLRLKGIREYCLSSIVFSHFLFIRGRPCKPERSTVLPHGHGCPSHSGKLSQSPTANLGTSFAENRNWF